MWIKAICRTEKWAYWLAHNLDRRIFSPSAINQKQVDRGIRSNGVYWWKDEQEPVNLLDDVYWQEDKTIEEFYNHILLCENIKALLDRCFFEYWYQKKFPNLEWEIHKEEHQFWVRIKTQSGGAFPVSLAVKDAPETLKMLESVSKIREYVKELSEVYPYLYFHPGTTDMPYTEQGSKVKTPYQWSVYVNRNGQDSTHTGYHFDWPVTDEIKEKLTELNEQSRLSQQVGWFFCTQCHKAYPKDHYGGFWFATTLCNTCATPEWKDRARRETYD